MTHDDTGGSVPALRTTGLGKRYGRQVWGLRDCSLTIPPAPSWAWSARTARARRRCLK